MARQLTREAKAKLLDTPGLFADVCILINVKPNSLAQLTYRNSPWLTNHDVVLRIASEMKTDANKILEEVEEQAPATV